MSPTSLNPPTPIAPGDSLYTLLIFLSLVLVLIVVILSAYLRLTGAGLGCENWPTCYGVIEMQTETASSLGSVVNRAPTWATVIHRLTATVLGALILGITVMALRRRHHPGQNLWIPMTLLGLTLFLALLGYATPSPLSPWVTLGNLLGGMTMLAMLWWLGQRSVSSGTVDTHSRSLQPWAFAGLFVIFFQIALGGWVSANFAALACTDLPGCGAFPWFEGPWRESFNLLRILPVSDDGVVIAGDSGKVIHFTHRVGAVFTFLFIGWLGIRAMMLGHSSRRTGMTIIILLCLQMSLGILSVMFSLPLVVVTAHNLVAAILLLSLVNLNHLLKPRTIP